MNETTSGSAGQVVHSPERYRLELPLAGPTSRILAYAIDYLLIALLQILMFTLVVLLTPLGEQLGDLLPDAQDAQGDPRNLDGWAAALFGLLIVSQLLVEWLYFVFLELTTQGRSLGKAIVKLRVVGDGGHPLRFTQSVARNLLRAVDILPGYYAVGLISMVALDEGKRLGDLAAGTTVIRLDRPERLPTLDTRAPSTAVFRFDHRQVAAIGRAEQRLVRQTLRRLPDLSGEQAARALERTVDVIATRIGHAPVPTEEREEFLRAVLHAAARR